LIQVLHRIHSAKDGLGDNNNATKHQIVGYTVHPLLTVRERKFTSALIQITMVGNGLIEHMNFEIKDETGMSTAQYYPSNILGSGLHSSGGGSCAMAAVHSLEWSRVKEEFIVHFFLCHDLSAHTYSANISAYSSTVHCF
jgi:hypothetical protein